MLRDTLGVSKAEYNDVAGAVFAYLFHRISMRELETHVGDTHFAHLQEVLRTEGTILRDYKLYAHQWWCAKRDGTTLPKAAEYNVAKADAPLLRRLNLSHVARKYEPMTIREIERRIHEEVYGDLMDTYIGKFINKKLLFLVKSYGVPRHDLKVQMQCAAMKGVYKQYPFFESPLHLRNLVKALIKNEGQTLISFHTRASRNRLTTNAEGHHEQVHVPMDAVFDVEYEPSMSLDVREQLQSLMQLTARMKPRVQQFLALAVGQHDEGFSTFLKSDNRDAIEKWPYERYLSKVQRYMNVTEAQMVGLFARLRPHL